jgi:hypothetical protein
VTIAVRDEENKLLGYVSIDRKSSLMVDALARTPADLEKVIGTSLAKLNESPELNFTEIKLMQTDITQKIIKKFGFSQIDFKFAFWRYSIDSTISREMLDISNWYVMPND